MSDFQKYQGGDAGNLSQSYDFLKGRVGQTRSKMVGSKGVIQKILDYYKSGLGKFGDLVSGGPDQGNSAFGVTPGMDENAVPGGSEEFDRVTEMWAQMSPMEQAQYGSFDDFVQSQHV